MTGLTRRRFIAGLAAGAFPVSLPAAVAADSPRIAVIGAGLAGLSASYELQRAGVDVTLFEASDRVGGRIWTVRDRFADGAWIDVGGQTIGASYANFLAFCQAFGLDFEAPTARTRADLLLHLNGGFHSGSALRSAPDSWPLELTADEKAAAPMRLLGHFLDPVAKDIGAVGNVLDDEFAHYDQLSLRELLKQRGATDPAVAMIDHTLNYNSVDSVSALGALRDRARSLLLRGGRPPVLRNGNQRLVDAFGERLVDVLRFEHVITDVHQDENGVRLQMNTPDGAQAARFDRVILAIPFTALRRIGITPSLPELRQRAIDELPYTQIAQTYLQTKTRFWEQSGPVSMIISDGPLERLFDASSRVDGEKGLLINWVNGTGTAGIASTDPEVQVENVISAMESVWPGCRSQIDVTFAHNWSNTYAGGAYAHYAPGQLSAFAEEIPKPIGRLHFAGEHTELVAAGMEGALVSGRRTAVEVMSTD